MVLDPLRGAAVLAAAGLALAFASSAVAQESRIAPAARPAVAAPAKMPATAPAKPTAKAGVAKSTKGTAPPGAPPDTPSYSASIDAVITVHADRTAESVTTRRLKVLGEAALQSIGQQTLSYVEGMQEVEIVEAYTEKADGRKIKVDPATIITRDEASGLAAVYLRDAKSRTVIFPDLAVGDSVVLSTRTRSSAGVFPGHYPYQYGFVREGAFADSRLEFIAPKDLPLKVAALGSGVEDQRSEDGERLRHVITYRARPRAAEEQRATSPLDHDPRVIASTFANYE